MAVYANIPSSCGKSPSSGEVGFVQDISMHIKTENIILVELFIMPKLINICDV